MIFNILTILPEMFPGSLAFSLIGKALKEEKFKLNIYDLKEYGLGKHKQVDDAPFGGGAGMVMRPDVLGSAIEAILKEHTTTQIYYLTPKGVTFTQHVANKIIENANITIICGRFEGIDQRIIEHYQIKELSIGDYVLCGGEAAAMCMIESIVRLLPGVLGNHETLNEESFSVAGEFAGLLEYPLYTRPQIWNDYAVPEVLLSGNHAQIKAWKINQALIETKSKRPDLLNS
ncbi:tRNA (guanosine(37)-N1)-methyltransferase TrmD [Rickettsiales endosymbiont of Stachyamoeba lipophora]|uniref:tRNA (guanosine(37)-N1)-methyltransferase TrmD n=1 Tax=Rickettsiales endosymbiont of Stachyamoeba lipophora TaxID=2486578 RepID=UPI000F64D53B|nr:tRNA (guanosine(37)-N1)-methyltransferase TrmD [Rickettsiales endosymbiont of Stachyamoeba lipophora]AZL15971.1 tRNA (guanosine(37)-N1)-methyltransferase TrmD [Rickettsiales endosymbiont of Stachyamoeba lipophora]